jgi:hypothetical protein
MLVPSQSQPANIPCTCHLQIQAILITKHRTLLFEGLTMRAPNDPEGAVVDLDEKTDAY